METDVDVLVIGASQTGLAAAYYLKMTNANFVVVGREKRVGDVWRKRYDSLVLFTPRRYSSLPGLTLEGEQDGYAAKDEIAEYLERYVQRFDLPVRLETEVRSLTKEQGIFRIQTSGGEWRARNVIVATGPFQKPRIPEFAASIDKDLVQLHTSEYLNPSDLQEGSVAVVGAGNSGAQIAVELSKDRDVLLSVGHKMKFLPLKAFGKSMFWWFDKLGMLEATIHSAFGHLISRQPDPIFGLELRSLIREGRVEVKPRATRVQDQTVIFEDGSKAQVRNLIWATGFRSDYSWIKIPDVLDGKGKPVHIRGVSRIDGLYFLGLPWQYRRGSALIGGVGRDAEYVINHIRDL
ncbi:flavin-containing monooxygenase [Paenibacillus chartarius]|uniref:Flavin-containing monooxygenase n=1 Tax=Paenibacillus chartarius TaxID=747481 RepID=A0ABV6DSZ5_9BACL